jgi:glutathione S-transferase
MATEPLTLYGYLGHAGLPDISPFVVKVEDYLRLAGLDYDKQVGDVRKAPRNKLPYLSHAGNTIPDSAEILTYLRTAGLADLDDWLDAAQRAELVALQSMLELELYFIIVFFRWQDPQGWANYGPVVAEALRASGVPGFVSGLLANKVVRKQVVAQLHAQGAGRRKVDENLARARELFAALEHFVGRHEGPWWFGAKPSSADAIAHAFVASTTRSGLATKLDGIDDEFPGLRAWFEHVEAAL